MLGPFGKSGGRFSLSPERYHLTIVLADYSLTLFGLRQGHKVSHSFANGIIYALAYSCYRHPAKAIRQAQNRQPLG